MQKLLIGGYRASIKAPHGLTESERLNVAHQFMDRAIEKIGDHGDISLFYHVEYARNGCINFRAELYLVIKKIVRKIPAAAVAVVGTGVALTAVQTGDSASQISSFLTSAKEVLTDMTDTFNCNVRGDTVACQILTCKLTISDETHFTEEGDTLESVVKNVWKVAASEQKAVIKYMARRYKNLLKNEKTGELKPGYVIALLKKSYCQ